MHFLFLALAATPDPTPAGTLKPGLTEDQVSPGLWGFLATAFVVLLSIFLIVDMVRRLRRVRYRGEVEEAREAKDAAAREPGEQSVDDVEPVNQDEDLMDAPVQNVAESKEHGSRA
ncbi:hypothetical protein [Sinomonas albida]|uniref:hypothetical protein n=1 Tax=Sinomonas albida TaxID=369942 RepID=UPI001B3C5766|nr:hypothetical protein [Sinomonas albida]